MLNRTSARVVIVALLSLSVVPACKKHEPEAAPETAAAAPTGEPAADPAGAEAAGPTSTIVEEGELGTITWKIGQDGRVEAVVKRPDGTQVTKEVTGTVTWPGEAADSKAELTLEADGRLVASGPALEADLTQIDYALVIEGKPWNGVLHVPRGGTQAIDEDARAQAATAVPVGKKGPNGGVIQIIGGEPMEVVADSNTGEMRVYVLGPDYQVIDPGERRVKLGYVADTSETLEMVREPGGMYFVTRVRTRVDPVRITLAVGIGASVHCGIVGFRAGHRLGVGVRAPVIPVMVARTWTPSVAVRVGVGARVGGAVRVDERVRVGVRGGARVDERVSVRERVDVKGHVHAAGCGHDHGRGPERGRGHDHDHGGHAKVHVAQHGPAHHGGPSHGGGGKGKRR